MLSGRAPTGVFDLPSLAAARLYSPGRPRARIMGNRRCQWSVL